jgi:hypothetical protein
MANNEEGLIYYLKHNKADAFPEDLATARSLDDDQKLLDLYLNRRGGRDGNINKSYIFNSSETQSQFGPTLVKIKKLVGALNYADK